MHQLNEPPTLLDFEGSFLLCRIGTLQKTWLKKVQKFGEQSVWPQMLQTLSQCVWFISSGELPAAASQQSSKTMLGNLWSQQCSTKSMWQEASRSWFYIIFKCIKKRLLKEWRFVNMCFVLCPVFSTDCSCSFISAFSPPFFWWFCFFVLSLIGYLSSISAWDSSGFLIHMFTAMDEQLEY